MIMIFGETSDAVRAGAKTVTRRNWTKEKEANIFQIFRDGIIIDAWNYKPGTKAARKIAEIKFSLVIHECTSKMNDFDYHCEGFRWMDKNPLTSKTLSQFNLSKGETMRDYFERWKLSKQYLIVIDFYVVRTKGWRQTK